MNTDVTYEEAGKSYISSYLTIEEMRELANQDGYRRRWEADRDNQCYLPTYYDPKTNLTYCDRWYDRLTLLHKHLLVEEYMQLDFDLVNWESATNNYNFSAIAEIELIYTNPLAWKVDALEPDGFVFSGRVAHPVSNWEEYDFRQYKINKWLYKIMNRAILYFADNLLRFETDNLDRGVKSGMHRWHYLMLNIEEFETYVQCDYDFFRSFATRLPYFHADSLLKNIRYIKEQRGTAKAVEIVKLFQSEWDDIELLDTYHYSKYPSQQITKFKRLLFKGFNKELGITGPDKDQAGQHVNIVVNGDYVVGDKIMGHKEND